MSSPAYPAAAPHWIGEKQKQSRLRNRTTSVMAANALRTPVMAIGFHSTSLMASPPELQMSAVAAMRNMALVLSVMIILDGLNPGIYRKGRAR